MAVIPAIPGTRYEIVHAHTSRSTIEHEISEPRLNSETGRQMGSLLRILIDGLRRAEREHDDRVTEREREARRKPEGKQPDLAPGGEGTPLVTNV